MIRYLVNMIAFLAVALAIAIQYDEYNTPLMCGHILLMISVIVCFTMAALNAAIFLGTCIQEAKDLDRKTFGNEP